MNVRGPISYNKQPLVKFIFPGKSICIILLKIESKSLVRL